MSVRYTDGAKALIGAVLIGAVALAALFAFILFKPEHAAKVHIFQPEKLELKCENDDYIGYANDDEIGERMEEMLKKKYEIYCLEKTGVRQWSIYGR
ncbi:TPA: hypothetical protein I9Y49_000811 [Citrobacter koseri]|nr:hypothetical protein [Citrobacter koseri]